VLVEEQVVGVGPVHAADLVDVAEALGDQQRGVGARALQQRVDRDGRAVQEQVAVAQVDVGAVQGGLDAVDQRAVGGQRLAEQQLAVASSNAAMSVKVPPMSTAMRSRARPWRWLPWGGPQSAVAIGLRRMPRPVISTSVTSPAFM
jgi:hypothetical protein